MNPRVHACVGLLVVAGILTGQTHALTFSQVTGRAGRSITTVKGRVVSFDCSSGSTILNLDQPAWKRGVSVSIPASLRSAFPPRLEDRYLARDVSVTGVLERIASTDRSRIVLDDVMNLRVVREPERPPAAFEPQAVRACDKDVVAPKVLVQAKPVYTSEAMRGKITGVVYLQGVVLPDGRVGQASILHSLDRGLDEQALIALDKWRFQPGTFQGQPFQVIVTFMMPFTLR